jgi:hypothetical protein
MFQYIKENWHDVEENEDF